MRIRASAAGGALALLLLVGCSSSSNGAATTTTASSKNVAVETTDGQVSLSLDGQLPPNWPTGFPVPSGAVPAGSGSLVNGGSGVLVGVYTTADSPSDTFSFYASDAALTVTKSGSVGSGDWYVGTIQFSGDPSGNVTVVPALNDEIT